MHYFKHYLAVLFNRISDFDSNVDSHPDGEEDCGEMLRRFEVIAELKIKYIISITIGWNR